MFYAESAIFQPYNDVSFYLTLPNTTKYQHGSLPNFLTIGLDEMVVVVVFSVVVRVVTGGIVVVVKRIRLARMIGCKIGYVCLFSV